MASHVQHAFTPFDNKNTTSRQTKYFKNNSHIQANTVWNGEFWVRGKLISE